MRAGPLLMIGLEGETLTHQEKKIIQKENIGGVLLFKRSCQSYKALKELISELYSLRVSSPLIVAIDREGGVVDRLTQIKEFYPWPNPSELSDCLTLQEIEQTSFYLHHELKHLRINMNFSPCLDISNPRSMVLKGRTFSSNPARVSDVGGAVIQGGLRAGVLTCAKHFPGHGGVAEDSHEVLPVDRRSKEKVLTEALPFRRAFAEHVSSVMVSHVQYTCLDLKNIAPFSNAILDQLLKKKWGFQGLVLTDDLEMKAVSDYNKVELAERALTAGAHMLISSNNSVLEILEEFKNTSLIQKRVEEVIKFKKKYCTILTGSAPPLLERKAWFEKIERRLQR
ncbi:MAG: beta-N-acetylhexosaminidase [Bdellovibrionales bacterium]|nr:beta-N-acetylhexosaminidase [Bdellovibrionales bacterium]